MNMVTILTEHPHSRIGEIHMGRIRSDALMRGAPARALRHFVNGPVAGGETGGEA